MEQSLGGLVKGSKVKQFLFFKGGAQGPLREALKDPPLWLHKARTSQNNQQAIQSELYIVCADSNLELSYFCSIQKTNPFSICQTQSHHGSRLRRHTTSQPDESDYHVAPSRRPLPRPSRRPLPPASGMRLPPGHVPNKLIAPPLPLPAMPGKGKSPAAQYASAIEDAEESPAPQPIDAQDSGAIENASAIVFIRRDNTSPGFQGRAWKADPNFTDPDAPKHLKCHLHYGEQLACERCLTKHFEVVYFAGESMPRFVCGCGHIWP